MTSPSLEHDLRAAIRSIPDYPKPGIIFRDITTLLGDARAFRRAVDELVQPWAGMKIDKVAGIEARGFILGVRWRIRCQPLHSDPQEGQTPAQESEYRVFAGIRPRRNGNARGRGVEGRAAILVDDLIATGGTAEGAVKLLRQLGANILAACFVIDLPELGGADKLRKMDVPVRTLISFEGH